MLGKKIYLEMGEKYIKHYKIARIGKKILKETFYELSHMKNIKEITSRGQLFLIYEGEELYVKVLKLPAVGKNVMETMVSNELNQLFVNMEGLTYNYDMFKKNKSEVELLVYCINSDKNKLIREWGQNIKIKGIYLLQLCMLQAVKSRIKARNFVALMVYNNNLYIIACIRKKIVANTLLKNFSGNKSELLYKLQYVMNRYRDTSREACMDEYSGIYFVNFEFKDIIDELSVLYKCVDLGKVELCDVISSIS